jgi:hypothetical protein
MTYVNLQADRDAFSGLLLSALCKSTLKICRRYFPAETMTVSDEMRCPLKLPIYSRARACVKQITRRFNAWSAAENTHTNSDVDEQYFVCLPAV